jgi:hypothetical protein
VAIFNLLVLLKADKENQAGGRCTGLSAKKLSLCLCLHALVRRRAHLSFSDRQGRCTNSRFDLRERNHWRNETWKRVGHSRRQIPIISFSPMRTGRVKSNERCTCIIRPGVSVYPWSNPLPRSRWAFSTQSETVCPKSAFGTGAQPTNSDTIRFRGHASDKWSAIPHVVPKRRKTLSPSHLMTRQRSCFLPLQTPRPVIV